MIENKDYVECKICGKHFKALNTHIKTHNITSREYLQAFPNEMLECKSLREYRSKSTKQQFLEGKRKIPSSNGKGLGGKRPDLNNQYFRSMWEANFARVLKYKNIEYKYEEKIPIYDENNNLLCIYVPDFYLPKYDSYIEIKGKWEKGAKEKVQLFKKYFPNKKITIIEQTNYKCIKRIYQKKISHWETSRSNIKNNDSLFKHDIDSKPKKKLYTCPVCHNNYYDIFMHLTLSIKRDYLKKEHEKFKSEQFELLKQLFYNYDFNKHCDTEDFNIHFSYRVCKRIWEKMFSKEERQNRKQILINNTFENKKRKE